MMILSRHGISTICPACGGPIWINTAWAGLPAWQIPEPQHYSGLFKCPFCKSHLNMYKYEDGKLEIHIQKRGKQVEQIQVDFPLILEKDTLIKLMENLLKTFWKPKGSGTRPDKISFEVHFNDVEHLRGEISSRIISIIRDYKAMPIPVLDMGGD